MRFSDIQPRHVLCILGREGQFLELCGAMQTAIDLFAPEFEIDADFSQDAPDDRMDDSFGICWDRVHKVARTEKDDKAVHEHGCVIYVLGPRMKPETAVETSGKALQLVVRAIDSGAVAVKGESAGVAHGINRWKQFGRDVEQLGNDLTALARLYRLAFSRRPLAEGKFFYSVGFHLIGLPEICVSNNAADDELELCSIIDRVADELFAEGVDTILERYRAELQPCDGYDEDEFKFNPYGCMYLYNDNKLHS